MTTRTFDTGANRDTDEGKLDYEAFLSPLVLERYAQYLHEHRKLPDGTLRGGDNWQKGMPLSVYMKSGWRHFHAWWAIHRGWWSGTTRKKRLEDAICAVIFNASGYLHEHLKVQVVKDTEGVLSRVIEDALGEGGYERANTGRPVVIPPEDSNRHC